VKDHYTRLQVLKKSREFSLPDKRRQLNDHKENRVPQNDSAMVLTMSNFLALSLVRGATGDVVAVAMDQLTGGILSVTTTRNHPTRMDVKQAEMIKDVIVRHFIAPNGAKSASARTI
jgi:hypothetical protein